MHKSVEGTARGALALVALRGERDRRTVVAALEATGLRVIEATTAEDALATAWYEIPAIAVIDAYFSPLEDGRHAAVALSQLGPTGRRPSVVIAAAKRDEYVEGLATAAGGARVFVMPRLAAKGAAAPLPGQTARAEEPRSVWVVDDSQAIQLLARCAFERAGWHVSTFEDLSAAYAGLSADPAPHAVLLDIHLPDGNGLDHVRTFDAAGSAVVMVSNVAGPDQVEVAFAAGAVDVVPKPFDLRSLVARVERAARSKAHAAGRAGEEERFLDPTVTEVPGAVFTGDLT